MDFMMLLALLPFLLGGASAGRLTVTNKCSYPVWPGVWTDLSSPKLSTTGFALPPNASATIDAPAGWSGRLWSRTGCGTADGRLLCLTADCNSGSLSCGGALPHPPLTYIVFTAAAANANDSYAVDVSVGFNVPASVTSSCGTAACPADVNAVCPPELRVVAGGTVACKSACQALNDPADCCIGEFTGPERCKPTAYTRIFKGACPLAVSYPFDTGAVLSCAAGSDYQVTFCP